MHIYLFRNWRCSQQISDIDDGTQKLHEKATENAKVPMYMKATPPLLEIKILLTMYCGCCRLAFCSVLDEASGSFVCQMFISISINVAVVTFPRILIQKTFYLTFDSNQSEFTIFRTTVVRSAEGFIVFLVGVFFEKNRSWTLIWSELIWILTLSKRKCHRQIKFHVWSYISFYCLHFY